MGGIPKPALTDADSSEIASLYLAGESMSALAGKYGRTNRVIRESLVNSGVTIRTKREAFMLYAESSSLVNTPIELRMHDALRAAGIGFATQTLMLGHYIVDIEIRQARVIIEADGATHRLSKQIAKDAKRDAALAEAGYRVFRFTGSEINRDAVACVRAVIDACGLVPEEAPVYDVRTNFSGENHPLWKGGKQEYPCERCGVVFLSQPKHRASKTIFCSRNCYDASKAGRRMAPETREKIRASLAGRPRGPRGPVTDATRAKLSASLTGKRKSPEHVAKVAAANRGKPKSAETRAKISESLKQWNASQVKIESALRGDSQRPAEMTGPATLF